MRKILLALFLGGALGACQSTDPNDYRADAPCLQRQVGHKVLTTGIGVGLGLAGVPGGGLVSAGIGMVTSPRCEAFLLTDAARERLAKERVTRARLAQTGHPHDIGPVAPAAGVRPLDPLLAQPVGRP